MEKIAIIGAGGFGREVKMLIDQINSEKKVFEIVGFYDDRNAMEYSNGLPYLGTIDKAREVDVPISYAVAVGDPNTRKSIIQKLQKPGVSFPNLIHPNVLIGKDEVTMGMGNIICAGTIITINIKLYDFIILNLSCTVGHDTIIHSFSSFMPSVNISGEVCIREGVYVGTGAKIINQLEIGENAIIGAGAVVAKSIPPNCTAVGIPAKPIKFHDL